MEYKKKGITPIISVILLLMMTIAAFGVAYVWLMQFQKGTQTEVGAYVDRALENIATSLTVMSVYYDSGTDSTRIVLYNSGENYVRASDLQTMQLLLDGVPQTITKPTTDLAPGNSVDIIISGNLFTPDKLQDGKVHDFVIRFGEVEISYACGPVDLEQTSC